MNKVRSYTVIFDQLFLFRIRKMDACPQRRQCADITALQINLAGFPFAADVQPTRPVGCSADRNIESGSPWESEDRTVSFAVCKAFFSDQP